MAINVTEQEQLDQVKHWWESYGKPVMLGAAIGLVLIGGYQWYRSDREEKALAASAKYQQMLAIDADQTAALAKAADELRASYPASPYAVLAAMLKARALLADGDAKAAGESLQWASDHATNERLADLARLRLTQLAIDGGNNERARTLIDAGMAQGSDSPLYWRYAELRGDLLAATGDPAGAATAYQQAIDNADRGARELLALLQLKRDDLGIDDTDAESPAPAAAEVQP